MLVAGTQIGPYQISGLIGAGGMGEVYRATDTRLRRDVAIKVLPDSLAADADRRARFQREAETLAALNHSHIAGIYGMEQSGANVYLVLEFVEGETLADRIRRGPIPVEDALRIARQMAIAIDAAHSKGIIHRDLKPANVKITPEGQVKVLDFGLAKMFGGDGAEVDISNSPTQVSQTVAGTLIGTAAYMSPEQARGRDAGTASDVWAFGCVLFEMLTGRQAFAGDSLADILGSIVKSEPDWSALPADTPIAVRWLLRRCLQKDREKRKRDMGDVASEIEQALAEPAVAGTEPISSSTRTTQGRRLPSLAWGGVVIALVVPLVAILSKPSRPIETRPAVHLAIDPPHRFFLRGQPTVFAVSPDGQYVTFVAEEANRSLWLRRLNSIESEEIPGTGGASLPFWSPDSKYIGFYSGGSLKKVSVDGYHIRDICEISGFPRGLWSTNNTIVYGDVIVYSVSADGGNPQIVMTPDNSKKETFALGQFLPDGDRFLIAIQNSQPEESGLWVVSLKSREKKRILSQPVRARYSTTGHLVYSNDGAIVAQAFDLNREVVTGEPIVLSAGSPGERRGVDISTNGILAYAGGSPAVSQLVWVDREGNRQRVPLAAGAYRQVRLSPDASKAVIVVPDAVTNTQDLWLLEMSSGVFSRFTSTPFNENDASWSADGKEILFAWNADIYKKMVGGLDQTPVYQSKEQKWMHDLSRDGRLVFANENGVYYLPSTKPNEIPVPILENRVPKDEFKVSPDNKWIAYNSQESGRDEVYVGTFPKLEHRFQVSINGGVIPRWRGDVRELFYLAPDGSMMAVDLKPSPGGDTLVTGTPHALFKTNMPAGGLLDLYDVTADGKRFLIDDVAENVSSPPITVVVNWPAELKKQK
jgi:serine/threonine protein kinase